MINLNLRINQRIEKIELNEGVLFNTVLYDHLDIIKKLIKMIYPSYKIDMLQFKVINKFIEFDNDLVSVYPGLIVKTRFDTYAVLYLENTIVDDEYMISIIREFISDTQENPYKTVNIDKFEVNRSDFLKVIIDLKE